MKIKKIFLTILLIIILAGFIYAIINPQNKGKMDNCLRNISSNIYRSRIYRNKLWIYHARFNMLYYYDVYVDDE